MSKNLTSKTFSSKPHPAIYKKSIAKLNSEFSENDFVCESQLEKASEEIQYELEVKQHPSDWAPSDCMMEASADRHRIAHQERLHSSMQACPMNNFEYRTNADSRKNLDLLPLRRGRHYGEC